jgi:hypothetical protein
MLDLGSVRNPADFVVGYCFVARFGRVSASTHKRDDMIIRIENR